MKRSTHTVYITIIALLLMSNVCMFVGKPEARLSYQPPAYEGFYDVGDSGGKVNINTAGIEELDTLYGVGEATAKKIISKREELGGFRYIEDIMTVDGISEKKFDDIKDSICVD